jgi:hypothetical protein
MAERRSRLRTRAGSDGAFLGKARGLSGKNPSATLRSDFDRPAPSPRRETATSGVVSASSQATLSNTLLDITVQQQRTPAQSDLADSFGTLCFSVEQNVGHVASGWSSALDSDPRTVNSSATLDGLTTSTAMFDNHQQSKTTVTGGFSLAFVPESTSALLVGVGLFGLGRRPPRMRG